MSSSLSGKIVLIVGGASGIGQAAAKLCAARGASVVVADNNETAGAQTAAALNVLFLPVNVADENSVSAMCAAVKQRHGRLDALVQTAGVLHGAYLSLEEFSLEIWSSVLDVNLTGSFLCAKHTVPLLKRSERGVLVLVSSLAATSGSSSNAYGAS